MNICYICHEEVAEDQICRCYLYNAPFHPQCYVDARPPYPDNETDPQLLRAEELISKTSSI
jgi:hypothetical protein